jgi:hypothetical protein
MPFTAALLLRCLLALALVAGGVPTFGMASAVSTEVQAAAMTGCHELAASDSNAADHAAATDCCGSADCLCDCLQHMPAAALAVSTLPTPVFPSPSLSPPSFERTGPRPASTLRPPIA